MEPSAPAIQAELLEFFKALADANRLKIVGLLATQTYSVEQIASILSLAPSTVSHHLAKLTEAGLVSATVDGYYNVYRLETKILEEKSKRLLTQTTLSSLADGIDTQAYGQKVIRDYSNPDGTLKTIPAQRKKLLAILSYIIQSFEYDRRYPEKEVNSILSRYHQDTASLRRELIGEKFMTRQNGIYWRIDKKEEGQV
jgi:DNA-binding transcriptional ArsR family regulator